jgi:hypothetical protein
MWGPDSSGAPFFARYCAAGRRWSFGTWETFLPEMNKKSRVYYAASPDRVELPKVTRAIERPFSDQVVLT